MGGPILGGYTGIDFDLLPLAFVVVIIGGMGSLKGALIGSDRRAHRQFRQGARPRAVVFTFFAPMVIVLAVKPTVSMAEPRAARALALPVLIPLAVLLLAAPIARAGTGWGC